MQQIIVWNENYNAYLKHNDFLKNFSSTIIERLLTIPTKPKLPDYSEINDSRPVWKW